MRKILLVLVLVISLSTIIYAQEDIVNEEELFSEEGLFSEEEMIVETEEVVSDDVGDELNQKSIGVSGEVTTKTSYTDYSASDAWLGLQDKPAELANEITGNAFFDVRLQEGIKSFLSVELSHFPAGREEENTINEFFLDANWDNKVYFRTGKQVLKWGRGYFWNPTDLINVERKDFLELDSEREGSYGTKVHIPFGAEKNVYFFLGMNDVEQADQISLAGKYEFLVNNAELSLSAWNKKGYNSVYGFDISSRIADVDLRGELSLSSAANNETIDYDSLELITEDELWIPRVSMGFTKYFDYGELTDRISLTGEVYYNQLGYDKNIFKQIEKKGTVEDKIEFLSDVYQPYSNSKYYLALFSSVDKFIIADATLNLNTMFNLVDSSAVVGTGISYKPLTDIVIAFDINGYVGGQNTEATFSGNKFRAGLSTKILF